MAKKHTVSETNETISAVITALGEGAVLTELEDSINVKD